LTPADTLAALVPKSLHRGHTTTSEDGTLSVVLDDGHGGGLLTVNLMTAQANTNCNGSPAGTCTVESDGTVYVAYANRPLYADEANLGDITVTTVELFYPDGRQISISNYNAPRDQGVEHSRPAPILSIAQLTQMARSKHWVYPQRVS
jgi:large exoprotein involved in heme utilization and adhesion